MQEISAGLGRHGGTERDVADRLAAPAGVALGGQPHPPDVAEAGTELEPPFPHPLVVGVAGHHLGGSAPEVVERQRRGRQRGAGGADTAGDVGRPYLTVDAAEDLERRAGRVGGHNGLHGHDVVDDERLVDGDVGQLDVADDGGAGGQRHLDEGRRREDGRAEHAVVVEDGQGVDSQLGFEDGGCHR